jgi:hypothetical protein
MAAMQTAEIRFAVCCVLAACVGCGGSPQSTDANVSVDSGTDSAAGYRWTVKQQVSFSTSNRTFSSQLIAISRGTDPVTYVHFIASDKAGPRPTVVLTEPYASVAFSEEEVDLRWAQYFLARNNPLPGQTSFLHPDVDGPAASAAIEIFYEHRSVVAAQQLATPHLLNDFAVVMVYGKFYAGGSVTQDIADMRAGMWLVAELPEVDAGRVGIMGGKFSVSGSDSQVLDG